MKIRRFKEKDAEKVSELIINTLWKTNAKDYSEDYLKSYENKLQPENIHKRASWTHFYVAENKNDIIGCGAIAPYWDKIDESSLFTIFVSPEYQGKGIGRKIIETLEKDEYFLRARRIEVPASITAVSFYKKMGYSYKNGIDKADDEGIVRMEKFR